MKGRRPYPLQVWYTKLERTIGEEVHVSRVACICVVPRYHQGPRGVDCNICLRLQHNGRRHNKTKTRESARTTTQDTTKRRPESLYEQHMKIQQNEDQRSLHKRQDKPTDIPVSLQDKDSILGKFFFSKATNPKGGDPRKGSLVV